MKEEKIYVMLGVLAYIIFNVGMFIFNYQHLYEVVGPHKGSMSIIHFTGCLVHGVIMLGSVVFLWFRIRGKNSEEKNFF